MGMPNTALSAKSVNEDRFLEGQMESGSVIMPQLCFYPFSHF